jgi:adenylate cyclase
MRAIGKGPSTVNPNLCTACFTFMRRNHGGAEIECSLLFADVRGSTSIAEQMPAHEFRALMDRFYRVASRAVFDHDGGVDKFVGDEIMAMVYPLPTGPRHAAQAVASAVDILRATGHEDPEGPWLPMGAGVHTGTAWVGALGDEQHVELTAIGDAVNVAARLAAAAAPGEIVISMAAADAADLEAAAERESLTLKGKAEPVDVVRVRITPAA